MATFDPLPSLQGLRLPVLAMIGGRDRDPSMEVKTWQAALAGNGDPRTEIRVAPGAGHVLTIGGTHMRGVFNEQALDGMAAWAMGVIRPARKGSAGTEPRGGG